MLSVTEQFREVLYKLSTSRNKGFICLSHASNVNGRPLNVNKIIRSISLSCT